MVEALGIIIGRCPKGRPQSGQRRSFSGNISSQEKIRKRRI